MSFKNLKENEILDFFMITKNKCRNCGSERIELNENELPQKMKNDLFEAGLKGRYLYCPGCKEYSIISNPEFG